MKFTLIASLFGISISAFASPPANLCPKNFYAPNVSREYTVAYTTTNDEYFHDGIDPQVMSDYCNRPAENDGNVQITTACVLGRAPGTQRLDICIMVETFRFQN